jgi:pantetheine-phosphate adenylyltransferase
MRRALFPGTFDPITLGHTNVINSALQLFDEIVIGIGINSNKQPMFSIEQRIAWIEELYVDQPSIRVQTYSGLTVAFCKSIEAQFILRGIRNVSDFEYEKSIADMNALLQVDVETVFLACSPMYASYSSTIVRDVIRNKGDYSLFVPENIKLN